jgi:hypothetical protein
LLFLKEFTPAQLPVGKFPVGAAIVMAAGNGHKHFRGGNPPLKSTYGAGSTGASGFRVVLKT